MLYIVCIVQRMKFTGSLQNCQGNTPRAGTQVYCIDTFSCIFNLDVCVQTVCVYVGGREGCGWVAGWLGILDTTDMSYKPFQ